MFNNFLLSTYNPYSVIFEKGKGQYLWDSDGKKYTDFLAGMAVCNLGHCHEIITESLVKQSKQLWQTSNHFMGSNQSILAQKISESAFLGKVFFCNSGAEANEGALKLARKWSMAQSVKKNKIVSFGNSFHGRTLSTLLVTGQPEFHKPYEPFLLNRQICDFNNLDNLSKITTETSAVIIEIVQGEGGVQLIRLEFLEALRQKCNEVKALLIFDEVQTGVGRTGKMWAWQHFQVQPDVMTFAKALGNGIPVGGFLVAEKFVDIFSPGDHGSTFGGNYLAMAVGLAVLKELQKDGFFEQVKGVSDFFLKELKTLQKQYPNKIREARGLGLLLGLEGSFVAREVVEHALEAGIVLNACKPNILRFVPSLLIKKEDILVLIAFLKKEFK